MDVLASMSLAGSIAAVIYFVMRPAAVKISNSSWRYYLLKLALFFYVVPVQLGKDIYRNIYLLFFPAAGGEEKYFLNAGKVIYIYKNGDLALPVSKGIAAVQAVCLAVTAVMLLIGLRKYFRSRNEFLFCSEIPEDYMLSEMLARLKKELKIKRNVVIRTSGVFHMPLTFGVVHPYVLIPVGLTDPENASERDPDKIRELEMILRHELIHVKQLDAFVRLMGMVALALNWYNPLVYFVLRELDILGENVCDEKLVLSMSLPERRHYGNMILDMICAETERVSVFAVSFSYKRKRVKERIELMLNVKRNKRIFQVLSAGIIMAAGVMSSLTVFAYDEPRVEKNEAEVRTVETDGEDLTLFLADDAAAADKIIEDSAIEAAESIYPIDSFVDDEGNVYEISDTSSRIGCTHNMISGTCQKHYKNGEGCTVKIYDADYCTKCEYLVLHSLINTITYTKCPH